MMHTYVGEILVLFSNYDIQHHTHTYIYLYELNTRKYYEERRTHEKYIFILQLDTLVTLKLF